MPVSEVEPLVSELLETLQNQSFEILGLADVWLPKAGKLLGPERSLQRAQVLEALAGHPRRLQRLLTPLPLGGEKCVVRCYSDTFFIF